MQPCGTVFASTVARLRVRVLCVYLVRAVDLLVWFRDA